jgi:hypothetical protein
MYYPDESVKDVARAVRRTVSAVRSKARVLGISKGRRPFTVKEIRTIKARYANEPTSAIAADLMRPLHSVYQCAGRHGIKKSPTFLASIRFQPGSEIGKPFRFPKGHVPTNKGARRPGWYSGRMRETQFKRGHKPHTWRPVGTILADSMGYLRIKVRERKPGEECSGWHRDIWPLLHHKVWIELHGPIPPKHVVVFKDRDRGNVAIENLELITMAELARRNAMWNSLPRELALAIQLNGVLKRKLRRNYGKKQN